MHDVLWKRGEGRKREGRGRERQINKLCDLESAIIACNSTVQYSTVQYNTVQYSTVQHSTVQYNTVQYNTV